MESIRQEKHPKRLLFSKKLIDFYNERKSNKPKLL